MARKEFLGGHDNPKSIDYYYNTAKAAKAEMKRLKPYRKGRRIVIQRVKDEEEKLGRPRLIYRLRVYD